MRHVVRDAAEEAPGALHAAVADDHEVAFSPIATFTSVSVAEPVLGWSVVATPCACARPASLVEHRRHVLVGGLVEAVPRHGHAGDRRHRGRRPHAVVGAHDVQVRAEGAKRG
jgi:hypothetical protein